jgi:DNA-binding NtrC family response regulator
MESDKTMHSIMVVDDEENILKAIRRELERAGPYKVETFHSPERALIHAKDHRFNLLIADYNMPWMHGLTLTKKFLELQPHAATIIISADADRAQAHSNFNEIAIPYLLPKPWQMSELRDMVAMALSSKSAD